MQTLVLLHHMQLEISKGMAALHLSRGLRHSDSGVHCDKSCYMMCNRVQVLVAHCYTSMQREADIQTCREHGDASCAKLQCTWDLRF